MRHCLRGRQNSLRAEGEIEVSVSGRKKETTRGKAKRCPQCLVLQDEDVKSG